MSRPYRLHAHPPRSRQRLHVICRYLVEQGNASLSAKTKKGHTPRYMARSRGQTKVAAFISELGMNITHVDSWNVRLYGLQNNTFLELMISCRTGTCSQVTLLRSRSAQGSVMYLVKPKILVIFLFYERKSVLLFAAIFKIFWKSENVKKHCSESISIMII